MSLPQPPQRKPGPSAQDWQRIISAIIFVTIAGAFWVWCGHFIDDVRDTPPFTPHGLAAKMCDSLPDHTDPDIIKYGDTWYSADCLSKYGQ